MFNKMLNKILLTSLVTALGLGSAPKLEAQTYHDSDLAQQLQEIQFVPPQGGEEPETRGAGTRNPLSSSCTADEPAMQLIMPEGNYGLTTQARPAILLYLPQTTATKVVLSFRSEDREEPEVAFLAIDSEQAINSFALPLDKPELEIGKTYQWQLSVVCGDLPHVNDPLFTGWVTRTPLDLSLGRDLENNPQKMSQQPPLEQARWFAANGYWYDLIQQIEIVAKTTSTGKIAPTLWLQLVDRF